MSESNDFLMSGGGGDKNPTAKFPTVGSTVAGHIVGIASKPIQQKDMKGELLTFKDGSPRLMLPVEVQTEEREAGNEDDTGIRVLFLKYKLRDTVAKAVRDAGAPGLEVGGHLTVTHSGHDGDTKLYEAVYKAPNTANDFLLGSEPTVTATLTNEGPTPAAADAVDPVATAKSLISLGQPDELVADVTGLAPAVVAAIRNTVAA